MDVVADATMAKGEFAAHIGVSPGRVSQYIAEGKIGADAIVGEGARARIRVMLAKQQIAARRDAGQALGNGLGTRLGADRAAASEEPLPLMAARTGVEEQLKFEKLRSQQIANRRAVEEEEQRAGRFTETATVREQMGRLAASMMQSMEGMLASFATAIAGQFSVPQRDVLHLLRQEFRQHRTAVARRHAGQLQQLPDLVETPVAGQDDDEADAA